LIYDIVTPELDTDDGIKIPSIQHACSVIIDDSKRCLAAPWRYMLHGNILLVQTCCTIKALDLLTGRYGGWTRGRKEHERVQVGGYGQLPQACDAFIEHVSSTSFVEGNVRTYGMVERW